MTRPLEGRVAIVTGGGWNVGRAIARRFAAEGARVVVTGRRAPLLEETAAAIRARGGVAAARPADVTDRAQVEGLVRDTIARHGTVDILAAIAGGGSPYRPLDEVDPAAWEQTIRQNLIGTFLCIRAVLPVMRENNAGSILTCAGGGAFFPLAGIHATDYAAAKAGICRLTDQLTAELLDTDIRVNALEPGQTWSPDTLRKVEEEERRTGRPHPDRARNHSPEDAAALALWLVSDASRPLRGRLVSTDDTWWRDPARVRAVERTVHLYRLRRHVEEDGDGEGKGKADGGDGG